MAQAAVNLPELANSQRRAGWRNWLILSPLLLWLLAFVVAPTTILLVYSFGVPAEVGHGKPQLNFLHGDFSQTLDSYGRIFRPQFAPVLWEAFKWGLWTSAAVGGLMAICRWIPKILPGRHTIFICMGLAFILGAGSKIHLVQIVQPPSAMAWREVLWALLGVLCWGISAMAAVGGFLAMCRWFAQAPPRRQTILCLVLAFGLAACVSLHIGIPAVGWEIDPTDPSIRQLVDPSVTTVQSLWRSVEYAAFTTVICLIVGYPVAFFIGRCTPIWRNRLLMLVMIPFWTSFLIRTYAWITILRQEGLLNSLLLNTGIIHQPLELFYNPISVTIGLLYNFLPFMILPIYGSVEKLDNSLIEASLDLGARPIRTFLSVILPLTAPGIAAGVLLVFVPAIGMYAIYELMGGSKIGSIGTVIEKQFIGQGDNIPFGSALGMTVLVLFAAAYMLSVRRSPSTK